MGNQIKKNNCNCDLDIEDRISVSESETIEIEHKVSSSGKIIWNENKSHHIISKYNSSSFFKPLKTIRLLI